MKLVVTQDCECAYEAYWVEHIPVEEESIEVLKDNLEEALNNVEVATDET